MSKQERFAKEQKYAVYYAEQERERKRMSKPGQEYTIPYPKVMSEWDTMQAAVNGRSIARLGDGELRLLDGGTSISQVGGHALALEMRFVLTGHHGALTCIPHMDGPKFGKTWCKYQMDKYIRYYTRSEYGSAFVTRPDSAPWIDTPEYWQLTRQLWKDKDVTLVISEEHTSIRPGEIADDAHTIRLIEGPRRDAFQQIDRLTAEIGPLHRGQVILLCLGACATVLAVRLNMKYGAHALDLGHIGRFMRKQGRFRAEVSSGTE